LDCQEELVKEMGKIQPKPSKARSLTRKQVHGKINPETGGE
jgi:hypothetical protein